MNNIGKVRAFLTEFVIVILFFSMSAVITLQLFLKANERSEMSRNRTMAYIVAEQAAEKLKADAGDEEEFTENNQSLEWYDSQWNNCEQEEAQFVMTVDISLEATDVGRLVRANLSVADLKETQLCSLPVTIYLQEREAQ